MVVSLPIIGAPMLMSTNGIDLAIWDCGPTSDAPPILLCHGFPELAFSWRHQIVGLADAGVRVIAPDQRGYGLSACPLDERDYDLEHLCADLIGVMDAKGIEKAVLCGHDWGGLVVWHFAIRHPERVAAVIGVNTPFTKRPPIDPIALYRQRFGEDFYIVFFQEPDAPEALLEADVERTMRFFLRRPGPPASGGLRSASLADLISAYDPAADQLGLLNAEDLAVYVEAFTRTGFSGPVNWYRNFTRNWARSANLVDHVPHPSLMIMAELDAVLPPSAADGMEKYVPNLDRFLIKGSGHWTQQEKPAETTAAILAFYNKTFRNGRI
jgi:pimeloyl-ACP methyl ester carboxylesterase